MTLALLELTVLNSTVVHTVPEMNGLETSTYNVLVMQTLASIVLTSTTACEFCVEQPANK